MMATSMWKRWILSAASAAAVFGLCAAMADTASAQCLTPPGDLNKDGITNVLDLQCGIFVSLSYASNLELPACLVAPEAAADINCDGNTNVADVLLIVNYAVKLPLVASIDADGDLCPDACQVPGEYAPLPTIASGTSASPSWTLKATASGFQATGTSSSTSFSLKPKAVTSAD